MVHQPPPSFNISNEPWLARWMANDPAWLQWLKGMYPEPSTLTEKARARADDTGDLVYAEVSELLSDMAIVEVEDPQVVILPVSDLSLEQLRLSDEQDAESETCSRAATYDRAQTSVATSEITFESTQHSRERCEQREINRREVQTTLKAGGNIERGDLGRWLATVTIDNILTY